jgi:hypothetical protein
VRGEEATVSATPDVYAAGVASYSAGRLAEAESALRGVLTEDARHAGDLHFLGAIAYRRGRRAAAVQYLRQAVAAAFFAQPQENRTRQGP